MLGFWQFLLYFFGASMTWNLVTNTLLTFLTKKAASAKSQRSSSSRGTGGGPAT